MNASFNLKNLGVPEYGYGDLDVIGEAYWGSVPNGTRVDMTKAANVARERFLKDENTASLPLIPPIPDDIVKSFVYNFSLSDHVIKKMDDGTKLLVPDIKKAETMGTGTPGFTTTNALMHVIADQDVTYLYKRPYPVQQLIPVEANKGRAANFDIIGVFDFGNAAFGTEDQTFTESDLSPYNRTEYVKFLYSVGRVTKAAQYAGLAQIPARDILAIRVDAAQDALRALRERAMLGVTRDVTSTTNNFVNAGPHEYKGLKEIITSNTNTLGDYRAWVDGSGHTTYDQIMADLRNSYKQMAKFGMMPNVIIADFTTFMTISAGLMEYFRLTPTEMGQFTQGISKIGIVFPNSGIIPMVASPFLPMDSGQGCAMMIDTRLLARRVLWGDMYEELAKINLSQKFVISACETLIDKSDRNGTTSLHGGVFNLN